MKIAVSGKGGVGKTTLSSLLALHFAKEGKKVLAVDADPDQNLATALGIESKEAANITPLAEMKNLVAERTGASQSGFGGYFKMNPKVDDIPDKFSAKTDGIKLLVMGTVKKGGAGCVCPESVLLKALLSHLLVARDEVVILDMEAGLEHLGRATTSSVDALIAVVEPDLRSLQTAQHIRGLAKDIGLEKIFVVVNKASPKESNMLLSKLKDFKIIGTIPYSQKIKQANFLGQKVFGQDEALDKKVAEIEQCLRKELELKKE